MGALFCLFDLEWWNLLLVFHMVKLTVVIVFSLLSWGLEPVRMYAFYWRHQQLLEALLSSQREG
jgi:hypothetical protein